MSAPLPVNDLNTQEQFETREKVSFHARFSYSFIVLLVASSIITTLGLLLNVSAIVIGGMIISPLMWPLMKISLGISYEEKKYIVHAIGLLFFAVFIVLLSAFLITLVSPIKLINEEIVLRANPTLLDIFIAIAAGAVAALALSKKRVSDTLAGVAIATSLMPPLAVSGIGLALGNTAVFAGGFLLFFINVVSILFVSLVTFIILGLKKQAEASLRFNSLIVMVTALVALAIPLFFLLQNYSFKANAHQKVLSVLEENLGNISPSIHVQNVKTDLAGRGKEGRLIVDADVLVPEGLSVDYQSQEIIIKALEEALGRKVDLSLRLQAIISLSSQEEEETEVAREKITGIVQEEIQAFDSTFSIDSLAVSFVSEKNEWIVDVVLRGDPSVGFTQDDRKKIENTLNKNVGQRVIVNIDILSRIQLKSQPDIEKELIRTDVRKLLSGISGGIDVSSVNIQTDGGSVTQETNKGDQLNITADIRAPKSFVVSNDSMEIIKSFIEQKYKKKITLNINVIEKSIYRY